MWFISKESLEKHASPFQLFAAASPPLKHHRPGQQTLHNLGCEDLVFLPVLSPLSISPAASKLRDHNPGESLLLKQPGCSASMGCSPPPNLQLQRVPKPSTSLLALYPVPPLFILQLHAKEAALTLHPVPLFPSVPAELHSLFPMDKALVSGANVTRIPLLRGEG